ncbi:DUF6945 domain-containing protein [Escherichia coli]
MSQNETEKTEKYAFFYKRLLHSTYIVRQDTGEEIEIPDYIETLHAYMRDQYESFKARGMPFFESQESMGLKFKGHDRRWIAARIEVLNRLGLVKSEEQERDSYGHKRFHHTVIPLEEVSANLLFYGPEKISGGPLAEGMLIRALEKKKPRGKPKSKKVAQLEIEESENAAQSVTVAPVPATNDPEQQSGVSQPAGDSGDAISNDDAVNGGNVIQFPTVKRPDQPQMADIDTLNNWVEGYDDKGFMAYGAMWGITKPGAITDLIKSHIRKIQSDGYKGSRSVANDEPPRADAIYKQQQARRGAEAKLATKAPQQQEDEQLEFDDNEAF